MKQLLITSLLLLYYSAAMASSIQVSVTPLKADSLPDISHIIDMKAAGEKIIITYELKEGYGQRIMRDIYHDTTTNTLSFGKEYGKRDNGYYQLYMPYLIDSSDGNLQVVSQDDGELFSVGADYKLESTGRFLIGTNFNIPFPISLYLKDIQQLSTNKYIFIAREPNGGRQSIFISDIDSMAISEIRPIIANADYPTWMVNTGELAYSDKNGICAFAYRLYPKVDLFKPSGETITIHTVAEGGFDPQTVDYADMEEHNTLYFINLTQTSDYIYALYLGKKWSDINHNAGSSKIYKFNHLGEIVCTIDIPVTLHKIAALDDGQIFAWDGKKFLLIRLGIG